jgi:uncharacterized delta-60 repeat protein
MPGGIVRLSPDGSLDESFSAGRGFDDAEWIRSIQVQDGGKLLISGYFEDFNGVQRKHVARLNADGTTDSAFNAQVENQARGLPVLFSTQPDGKLLLFGSFETVAGRILPRLVRLHPEGTVDTSFSPYTGIANAAVYPRAVLPLPDGKLLASGSWDVGGSISDGIARLDLNGKLDPSFEPIALPAHSHLMHLQPDGKVLVVSLIAYSGFPYAETQAQIVRLNSDGTLDTNFIPVVTDRGLGLYVNRLALQPDGKVLIAGNFSTINGIRRNLFARLNTDGSLDESFDPNLQHPTRFLYQMVLQPDGKILVSGFTCCTPDHGDYFTRLNPDGTEDSTFAPAIAVGVLGELGLQPDGKILVDAWPDSIGHSHSFARLNPDGSRDWSFKPPPGITAPFATQLDGKIIVGYPEPNPYGTFRARIARLNPDGGLDTTFTPINFGSLGGRSLADATAGNIGLTLLPDSRIMLGGGFTSVNGVPRWHLARAMGDAPAIIKQPGSLTSRVGRTAVFTVAGSGGTPLKYQWYKDGAPLSDSGRVSGANSDTLTLNPVQFRDAGNYTVTLSNSAGSITSAPASLHIQRPSAAGATAKLEKRRGAALTLPLEFKRAGQKNYLSKEAHY